MGYSKRQFVEAAFEELGLAENAHDMQSSDFQAAVRRLDAMLAEWNGNGIRLGYPLVSDPENTSLDTETNVPDSANEAIYSNLAIKLGPSYGRPIMQETKVSAKKAYNTLLLRATHPSEKQFPSTLQLGAGHKPYRSSDRRFFPVPEDRLQAGGDGNLDFN